MKTLPKFLKKYFWDIEFQRLEKKAHSHFIIERILEYGDKRAMKWLKSHFEQKEIKNVLYNSKNISPRSANFWQLIFNIKRDKILCLRKSFQEKQRLIWKH